MTNGISGDAPRITISLAQVDDLNLESRASFKTAEDRVAFLDAIKNAREEQAKGVLNPTLEIPQPRNAQSLGLLAGKLDSSAIFVGSTLLDVMTILHEIGQQMRQAGKEARAVAREAEVDKLKEAADKIRQGAMFALASGITSGVMTIGGGLMSGIGAAKGANTAMKGIQAAKVTAPTTQNLTSPTGTTGTTGPTTTPTTLTQTQQTPQTTTTQQGTQQGTTQGTTPGTTSQTGTPQTTSQPTATDSRTGQAQKQSMLSQLRDKLLDSKSTKVAMQSGSVDASTTLGNMQMQKWQAAGQIMQGSGQVAGAALDSQAKFADAERADLEAESKTFGYEAQEKDEIVQKMLELMRDVRQKLGEIEQAQSQVQSKIWS